MQKVDYGIDAPGVLKNLFGLGIAAILLGWIFSQLNTGWLRTNLPIALFNTGGWLLFSGLLMLIYVKRGKLNHRDRILKMVAWTGHEKVLDVGTGRGLLLIGAAHQLTSGQAVGIDVWSQVDLLQNSAAKTHKNIEIEGVSSLCELKNEDVRKMRFPDGTFDIVLSNLCLHNIPDAKGRREACLEIARVLKAGGQALISDFQKTKEYVAAFEAAGFVVERTSPYWLNTFPPLRIVKARKPKTDLLQNVFHSADY